MSQAEIILRLRQMERQHAALHDKLNEAVKELAEKTSEADSFRSRLYSTNHAKEREIRSLKDQLAVSVSREKIALRRLHGGLEALGLSAESLEDALALSEKSGLLLKAFDVMKDPLFFAEPCGRIAYANPATEKFFGSSEGVDFYTLLINDLKNPYRSATEDSVVQAWPERHGPELVSQLDPNDPRRAVIRRHVKVQTPDRGTVDVLLTMHMMHGAEGRPLIMVQVVDIEGVHKDPLTSLWLRDTSDKALNRRIASREREILSGRNASPLAVAIVDIDHFKLVNDTYGHLAGDEVIRSVAQRLGRAFRRDTDLVARWGGEELLLMSDLPIDELYICAEELRESIARKSVSIRLDDEKPFDIDVTVSIGLAEWETGMDRDALTKAADLRLYEAKHSGRNRTLPIPTPKDVEDREGITADVDLPVHHAASVQ